MIHVQGFDSGFRVLVVPVAAAVYVIVARLDMEVTAMPYQLRRMVIQVRRIVIPGPATIVSGSRESTAVIAVAIE